MKPFKEYYEEKCKDKLKEMDTSALGDTNEPPFKKKKKKEDEEPAK